MTQWRLALSHVVFFANAMWHGVAPTTALAVALLIVYARCIVVAVFVNSGELHKGRL